MQEQFQLAGVGPRPRMFRKVGYFACTLLVFCVATASSIAREIKATVTAYCACEKCCQRWAGGPTASGKRPVEGITVAAPRRIKFGTKIFIEGIGERLVQDRLSRRYDNRFDIYFNDHDEAIRFGKRQLKIRVIDSRRV